MTRSNDQAAEFPFQELENAISHVTKVARQIKSGAVDQSLLALIRNPLPANDYPHIHKYLGSIPPPTISETEYLDALDVALNETAENVGSVTGVEEPAIVSNPEKPPNTESPEAQRLDSQSISALKQTKSEVVAGSISEESIVTELTYADSSTPQESPALHSTSGSKHLDTPSNKSNDFQKDLAADQIPNGKPEEDDKQECAEEKETSQTQAITVVPTEAERKEDETVNEVAEQKPRIEKTKKDRLLQVWDTISSHELAAGLRKSKAEVSLIKQQIEQEKITTWRQLSENLLTLCKALTDSTRKGDALSEEAQELMEFSQLLIDSDTDDEYLNAMPSPSNGTGSKREDTSDKEKNENEVSGTSEEPVKTNRAKRKRPRTTGTFEEPSTESEVMNACAEGPSALATIAESSSPDRIQTIPASADQSKVQEHEPRPKRRGRPSAKLQQSQPTASASPRSDNNLSKAALPRRSLRRKGPSDQTDGGSGSESHHQSDEDGHEQSEEEEDEENEEEEHDENKRAQKSRRGRLATPNRPSARASGRRGRLSASPRPSDHSTGARRTRSTAQKPLQDSERRASKRRRAGDD